jgi:transposase
VETVLLEDKDQLIEQLKRDNQLLREELAQLKKLIFGRKSEKRHVDYVDQPNLFGLENQEAHYEQQQVTAHTKKIKKDNKDNHPVRTSLPDHLPRQEEIIEPKDKPEHAKKIGEEVSERLAYNPASFFVIRTIRPKYVDVNEDKANRKEGVFMASMPLLPLAKSKVDSSLLAHILVSKFVDHLPLHRLLQQMKRLDIIVSSSTINDWFMNTCQLLSPLYEVLRDQLLQSDYLQADETPIKVQIKDTKGKTHQGYHWVYHDIKHKLVCFDYRKSRNKAGPIEFLKQGKHKFSGTLQTDGYVVYDLFEEEKNIILIGCMAHIRRKFYEARDNDQVRADQVLDWIGELYKWEKEYVEKKYNKEQIKTHRQTHHVAILDKIESYCQEQINKVVAKSKIATAMGYAIRQWKKIKRYTQNGEWLIDNNQIENKIRPVAIGRKNYLFAGSHKAAQYAAMIYSFVGSCKLRNIEPNEWLKHAIDNILELPPSRYAELLPQLTKEV